jgi:hypothetical protein
LLLHNSGVIRRGNAVCCLVASARALEAADFTPSMLRRTT